MLIRTKLEQRISHDKRRWKNINESLFPIAAFRINLLIRVSNYNHLYIMRSLILIRLMSLGNKNSKCTYRIFNRKVISKR